MSTESINEKTQLVQTSTVKVGSFIVVDNKPCKVLALTTAKPGKHGSSKTLFEAKDIISGKNVQYSAPSKGTILVPDTLRETYTVMDITDEGFLSLLRSNGSTRQDVRLPSDNNGDIIQTILNKNAIPEIVIMSVLGHDIIMSVKEE